jgi:signal-transduction protein with cAMP-binding, CBS, and nucleotidyltransferase domain
MTISPCDPQELRTLFLFEKLTDDQVERLCIEGHVEVFEPGLVYTEGEPAQNLYVMIEGSVVMTRRPAAS